MYRYKYLIKFISFLILIILIKCSTEKTTPQIQTLIEMQNLHTHDIIIYYEDIKNNRDDYYTSESLGHRHKVVINLLEKEQLLTGITIEKETEESMGHKHKIMLKIFDF